MTTPHAGACLPFLSELFGEAEGEQAWIGIWQGSSKRTFWCSPANLDRAAAQAERWSHDGADVYVDVAVFRFAEQPLPTTRGSELDVGALVGLWIDADIAGPGHVNQNLPATIEEMLQALEAYPLRPTLVVNSGHGVHCWWLFKEPWEINGIEDQARAKTFMLEFQEGIRNLIFAQHGWHMDNTADLARCLRLPGTMNYKADPVPVVLLRQDGPRYAPEDFEPYLLDVPKSIRVANGDPSEPIVEGRRNDTLASIGGSLRRAGMTAEEIFGTLSVINDRRCQPPLPRDEVKTIAASVARYETDIPYRLKGSNGNGNGANLKESTEELLTFADIHQICGRTEWLWKPWLPKGYMTLLVAASGEGKSALALRLAGSVLCGWPWPDLQPYTDDLGCVLWCEAESAQGLNAERAEQWKLPLDRIKTPFGKSLSDGLTNVDLSRDDHRKRIQIAAAQPDIKLVVADALSSMLRRDENSVEVLETTQWLAELARDTAKALIVVHHRRKRGIFDSGEILELDQMRGSSALQQHARIVLKVDRPNRESEDRRFAVLKSNLTHKPDPVGVRITDHGIEIVPVPQQAEREVPRGTAATFLLEYLADGPRPSTEVIQAGKQAGIAEKTLRRAKEEIGVIALSPQESRDKTWTWALPGQSTGKLSI